jgi:hypothetical protein
LPWCPCFFSRMPPFVCCLLSLIEDNNVFISARAYEGND